MDTKLKNIKYSPLTKVCAAILAVVMFFVAGFSASMLVKGFFLYGNCSENEFTQTPSFRSDFDSYVFSIIYTGEYLNLKNVEDYKKTQEGKDIINEWNEKKDMIRNAHALLESKNVEVYVDEDNRYRYSYDSGSKTYYFLYNGTVIDFDQFNELEIIDDFDYNERYSTAGTEIADSAETTAHMSEEEFLGATVTAVDENVVATTFEANEGDPNGGRSLPKEISDIGKALYVISNVGSYDYAEVSLETLLSEIDNIYSQQIEENYVIMTEDAHYWLDSLDSINFYVEYKTGTELSNCGITSADTQDTIAEKLGGIYSESLVDGKYTLVKGKTASKGNDLFDKLFNALSDDKYIGGTLEETDLYSVTINKAYFSYAPDLSAENETPDSLEVSQRFFEAYQNNSSFFKNLSNDFWIFVLSFLVSCALCIYLLCVSGKTAEGSVKTIFFDKIPFEINGIVCAAVMTAAAVGVGVALAFEIDSKNYIGNFTDIFVSYLSKRSNVLTGALFSVFFSIWTGINASIVRNVRNKSFWRRTICNWVFAPLRFVWKKLKKDLRKISDKIKFAFDCDYSKEQGSKKFKIISCVVLCGFVVLSIIYYSILGALAVNGSQELAFVFYVLGTMGDILIIGYVTMIIVSLDRIMVGASKMRKGDLNTQINTSLMPRFLRHLSQDILFMQDGQQKAVESAVKDQRMKAELITNVSHDLKTPLTSIVNYVDLLKKCEVKDETAQRYIDVLDEKAAKMKKLIEDLVEASKASTGNVEIHPVKLNLCEFAAQAVGEHEDELKKLNLELVLRTPETPVTVWADSQKTSRIIENLFSNIRKYALEGTRVFVEVFGGNDYGTIVVKNISKYEINVSADELTQRFVRGDSSRSGEGSGLGLSIAQNLCELQKGKFGIAVDGDLFKVTVVLPTVK